MDWQHGLIETEQQQTTIDSQLCPETVNDSDIQLHPMMNAAPEVFEETTISQTEVKCQPDSNVEQAKVDEIQLEKKQAEDAPKQEPEVDSKSIQEAAELTNSNHEDVVFNSCILSQSVDDNMLKVINNIVEHGGCQQFVQRLEEQEGDVDRVKEVENIQREIVSNTANSAVQEKISSNRLEEEQKEKNSCESIEEEPLAPVMEQVPDLKSFQSEDSNTVKVDSVSEVEANHSEEVVQEEIVEESCERQIVEEEPERSLESRIEEAITSTLMASDKPKHPSVADIDTLAKVENEVVEFKEIDSHEAVTVKLVQRAAEERVFQEPETLQQDSELLPQNLEDTPFQESDSIPKEQESVPQEEPRPARRESRKAKQASKPTEVAIKFIDNEKTTPDVEEPKLEATRRSSRRVRVSIKLKQDDEDVVEKTTKAVEAVKSKKQIKLKKVDTIEVTSSELKDEEQESQFKQEDQEVEQQVLEEKEIEEVNEERSELKVEEKEKEEEDEKEEEKVEIEKSKIKKQARVSRARTSGRSAQIELPKIKIERRPNKRHLTPEVDEEKSEPPVKAPATTTSRSALSRMTLPSSQPVSMRDYRRRTIPTYDNTDPDSKIFKCDDCHYETGRINNIVYHKKNICEHTKQLCSNLQQAKIDAWVLEIQSPKGNKRR